MNWLVNPDAFTDYDVVPSYMMLCPPRGHTEAGSMGSIPANPDAQNVPSFRRWRFEMKLSHFAPSFSMLLTEALIEKVYLII